MKVRSRIACSTCASCERETTHPVTYYVGRLAFSLCRYCAKRMVYLTERTLRTKAEA